MIGVDTNVLVRLVTQDDARQVAAARRYLDENVSPERPGFVNRIVFIELVWVLETAYDEYDRAAIADAIEGVLDTKIFVAEDAVEMRRAVARYRGGADFADATLDAINPQRGCTTTATFDRDASERLEHFRLIA